MGRNYDKQDRIRISSIKKNTNRVIYSVVEWYQQQCSDHTLKIGWCELFGGSRFRKWLVPIECNKPNFQDLDSEVKYKKNREERKRKDGTDQGR